MRTTCAVPLLAAFAWLPSALATPTPMLLWADRDDDDADGRPDCEQDLVPPLGRVDTVPLDRHLIGAVLHPLEGAHHARLLLDGKPYPWDRPTSGFPVVQGVSPGLVRIAVQRGPAREQVLEIWVRGIALRDGAAKPVDMARSHLSFERTPPSRVDADDPDAVRVLVEVATSTPPRLSLESVSSYGVRVDGLAHLEMTPMSCTLAGFWCWTSAPVRLVVDDLDRNHPLAEGRSIRGELGGALLVRTEGHKAQGIRILGPRHTPVGPIARLRATLRPFVVRVAPGGVPAIGGTDSGAVTTLRAELGAASAIWAQCGITWGDSRTLDVRLVDPPPPHLLAFGDDLGQPASGGEVRVRLDGHPLTFAMVAGASPDRAATMFAQAVERAGFVAVLSPNARVAPGAMAGVDVSVRRKDGTLASIEPAGSPWSTDATLTARIGVVDLTDGLEHFTDVDAMAGTLEERTLLKSLDDGDPQTIEVVVVPLFAGGGRIGESFIGSDLSSLRNVVLLDRAGIRARKSSLTLAHELGHVLLDVPGHPDDYGADTPSLLMDSDASDASPFGPRRLTLEECARVVRQSGPRARVPLLAPWPIGPIPADTRPAVGN